MILTTTPNIEGHRITEYLGIVTGEAILGTNFFRDFFAKIRDDAIVGIDLDYEVMGETGSMLMVSISGTAVTIT
jgi:uncharacterized protein YbjQ (UPF0145 family)